LPHGAEAYMSVGRDGHWRRPLAGCIDELRITSGRVYRGPFEPPASFAPAIPAVAPKRGPPLLFAAASGKKPVMLGGRKHVFLDDAMIAEMDGAEFVVNPPRKAERVIGNITGTFRKHLTVVEDQDGLIRIYNAAQHDYLAVRTSRDGVHFKIPDVESGASARNSRSSDRSRSRETSGGTVNGPNSHEFGYQNRSRRSPVGQARTHVVAPGL